MIFVNINAYWSPFKENSLDFNHFNLDQASSAWKQSRAIKEQKHYDQETAMIQASKDNADFLVRERGGIIYRKSDGRDIVTPSGWKPGYGFPILTDRDRTPLISDSNVFQKEFSAFTVDADLKMYHRDLMFILGTTISQISIPGFENSLPAVDSNPFKTHLQTQNYHAKINFRLWDTRKRDTGYHEPFPGRNPSDGLFHNFGPMLVVSYELEGNELGRNMANYFNPDFAKTLPETTEVWQLYLKWDY